MRLYITIDFHNCDWLLMLVCQLMNNAGHINYVQSLLKFVNFAYELNFVSILCHLWVREHLSGMIKNAQIIIIMREVGVSVTRMAIHLSYVDVTDKWPTNRLC